MVRQFVRVSECSLFICQHLIGKLLVRLLHASTDWVRIISGLSHVDRQTDSTLRLERTIEPLHRMHEEQVYANPMLHISLFEQEGNTAVEAIRHKMVVQRATTFKYVLPSLKALPVTFNTFSWFWVLTPWCLKCSKLPWPLGTKLNCANCSFLWKRLKWQEDDIFYFWKLFHRNLRRFSRGSLGWLRHGP